jgi:hypothetical protein
MADESDCDEFAHHHPAAKDCQIDHEDDWLLLAVHTCGDGGRRVTANLSMRWQCELSGRPHMPLIRY